MYHILYKTEYFKNALKSPPSDNNESFDRKAMEQLLQEFHSNKKNLEKFLRLYYLSKIYYPKFFLLIKKLKKMHKTKSRMLKKQ